ncbi:MAG: DUF1080 domain-containing protein [Acidobacteriota bacterium]
MKLLLPLLLTTAAFAADPGFHALFNGKSLDGWMLVGGKGPGYVVENGVLVCPADGGGNLLTEREYANFVLRFEFRMEPGSNNGVGIRTPKEGDAAYVGMEIQILDHNDARYQGKLRPAQHHGSIYDVIAATKDTLKPVGEWNREEITANGPQIEVKLNGEVITRGNLSTIVDPGILAKHPGIRRTTGHLGFLGHGTRVEFRNIQIKETK